MSRWSHSSLVFDKSHPSCLSESLCPRFGICRLARYVLVWGLYQIVERCVIATVWLFAVDLLLLSQLMCKLVCLGGYVIWLGHTVVMTISISIQACVIATMRPPLPASVCSFWLTFRLVCMWFLCIFRPSRRPCARLATSQQFLTTTARPASTISGQFWSWQMPHYQHLNIIVPSSNWQGSPF